MPAQSNTLSTGPYDFGQPLLQTRVGIADGDYSIGTGEYIVGMVSLTATRTITLPANSPIGRRIVIKDEAGNCSANVKIIISGLVDGASSVQLTTPYAFCEVYANGTNWSKIITG